MEMGVKESLVGVRRDLGKLLAVVTLGDAEGLDAVSQVPRASWISHDPSRVALG